MKSNTPETDAVWADRNQNILEHARKLEVERNFAQADIALLNQRLIERTADMLDKIVQLETTIRQLNKSHEAQITQS